jgi:hypothetical protein
MEYQRNGERRIRYAQLESVVGENGVPLTYVLKDEEELADLDLDKVDEIQRSIIDAPLQGRAFKINNRKVYQQLIIWTAGGSAKSFVDRYKATKDGRAAYMAMKQQFDGEHERQSRKAKAHAILDRLSFHHETQLNSLKRFCIQQIEAYDELHDCGEVISEPTKVTQFLNRIDSAHIAIKMSVLDNENGATEDLQKTTSHFSTWYYQGHPKLVKSEDQRKISATERDDGGRGGGGRGRGRGRGGRFGRGRGQGRDNSNFLPKKILDQMMAEQRKAFFIGRDALQNKNNNHGGDRKAGATAQIDDTSTITNTDTGTGSSQ